MSHWDFGQPPADQHNSQQPYGSGEATYRADSEDWAGMAGGPGAVGGLDDDGSGPYPITYERGRIQPGASSPAPALEDPYAPWPPPSAPDEPDAGEPGDDQWLRGSPPGPSATGEPPRAWPDDSFEASQPGGEPW